MSFFGFDTALPRDKSSAPGSRGIFDSHDPFASLHASGQEDAGVVLDFEETYDGLGHQLEESGDTFNDDTFGGEDAAPVTRESVGRDFDFAGQTAHARGALLHDQDVFQQHGRPVSTAGANVPASSAFPPSRIFQQQPSKPTRTGYEAYRQPEYIPKLEADASIWGPSVSQRNAAPAKTSTPVAAQLPAATGASKMMSLEEVEAQMRAQARPMAAPPTQQETFSQTQGLKNMLGLGSRDALSSPFSGQDMQRPPPQQYQQQQQQQQQQYLPPGLYDQQQQPFSSDGGPRAPQILQREQPPQQQQQQLPPSARPQPQTSDPRFAAQQQLPPHLRAAQGPPGMSESNLQGANLAQPPMGHARGPSYPGPPITHPQQMLNMDSDARAAFLEEEARRAKRNHKIFLLSRHNGLMTPQDKNFITRIQLQQLLTATGGIPSNTGGNENDQSAAGASPPPTDSLLAEDFYYQVYAQIRGPPAPPRGGPVGGGGQAPLNQFAQTYLAQTRGGGPASSRYGNARRHGGRHGQHAADNHIARMEQQVARAVEAARARPKNKDLVVAGSLGKIAFSNSKTPRPLLHLRPSSAAAAQPLSLGPAGSEKQRRSARKTALRHIETLYTALMRLEDHERRMPPPATLREDSPPSLIELHMRWRRDHTALRAAVWQGLLVMEPVGTVPHPFIQLLGPAKGKKVIPRVFRHLDDQQRLTMLTLLALHLDQLDVVRDAYAAVAQSIPLPPAVKDEVELFAAAVMPPLFSYVNDAPLSILIGLVGLLLDRVAVPAVVRTKIGLELLTMLISRAELVKQLHAADPAAEEDFHHWTQLYARLFDTLEPALPLLFPLEASPASSDDVHIWQFLAAMGVGASPDQQQRLVLGVKDRVMDTVAVAKTLPEAGGMRERRLAEVNLFMRAIGLDVELLG